MDVAPLRKFKGEVFGLWDYVVDGHVQGQEELHIAGVGPLPRQLPPISVEAMCPQLYVPEWKSLILFPVACCQEIWSAPFDQAYVVADQHDLPPPDSSQHTMFTQGFDTSQSTELNLKAVRHTYLPEYGRGLERYAQKGSSKES
jgi:hypothetical protein